MNQVGIQGERGYSWMEEGQSWIVYFDVVEYKALIAFGIVLALVILIHNFIISNETIK